MNACKNMRMLGLGLWTCSSALWAAGCVALWGATAGAFFWASAFALSTLWARVYFKQIVKMLNAWEERLGSSDSA